LGSLLLAKIKIRKGIAKRLTLNLCKVGKL
jgi:hypothetical protein